MTIDDKTYFTPDGDPQFLPISELDLLVVSLASKVLVFYDLTRDGWKLGTYYTSKNNGYTKNYLNLRFSNFTNELAFSVDMNHVEILKFESRYTVLNCKFFDYAQG